MDQTRIRQEQSSRYKSRIILKEPGIMESCKIFMCLKTVCEVVKFLTFATFKRQYQGTQLSQGTIVKLFGWPGSCALDEQFPHNPWLDGDRNPWSREQWSTFIAIILEHFAWQWSTLSGAFPRSMGVTSVAALYGTINWVMNRIMSP